ncbi:MAG TPA: hypothetical protein PKD94_15440, partial [Ignavibacteria bacterium]|nr:hypothetical protein [Ignavibacteria bacterium]
MKSILTALLLAFTIPVFSQWLQTPATPQGSGITGMVITDPPYNNYIVVTTGSVSGGQSGGVRTSYDGGQTWTNNVNCYIGRTITKGAYGYLFASLWYYPSFNEGIYYSSNGGQEWYGMYNFPAGGNNIFSLLNIDTLILAGTRTGILRSTNFGAIFAFSNSGMTANSWVWDIAIDSNGIVAAATSNGLFISSNFGDSWQLTSGIPAGDTVRFIGFYRTQTDNGVTDMLVCGTDDGKVLEAERNTLYATAVISAILGNNSYIEDGYILMSPESVLMCLGARPKDGLELGGGIFQSTNNGHTFTQINGGLPQNPVTSSITGIPGPTSVELIAGFFNNTNNGAAVFKRTMPIGISNISSEIPRQFSLSQNYPNPFNPVTNIDFSVPEKSFVRLAVFDITGRIVEILVKEELSAGTYKVDWNAANYS